MPKKPKGYKGPGQPTPKDVKLLKQVKAVLESNSLTDAYLKTHPNSSRESAKANAYRIITPELMEELRRVLALDKVAHTTRETIEKILYLVIAKWTKGDERTGDMIRALELLSKLVPDFKDRHQMEDISQLSEKDIDIKLKQLGVNPDRVNLN